jgi:three-Cys-motif partner protein
MKSIDLFLNFPIMDMNRNVLWKNPEKVEQNQIERMDAFWGDNSWRNVAYKKTKNLFGDDELKVGNEDIVKAFQDRLKKMAGFKFVPEPIPMRNTIGSVIYYLFFASPNKTGAKIAEHLFSKYRNIDFSKGR